MYNSKFKLAMFAAFALLVAAPAAGADPARVVSQEAEAKASALPLRFPDAGAAYAQAAVDGPYGRPDVWAVTALRGAAVSTPDAATIAGLRMNAAAEHYGAALAPERDMRSPDAIDAAVSTPDAATIAGLRMNAAAEHYGATPTSGARGYAIPDGYGIEAPRDLRSPDARDAANPRVTPTNAPVLAPVSGDQPSLAPADSDFPWAGLLVGLGLAGMAGLLALVAVRGTRARPLGR